jgi:hypothetical protein
MKERAIVIFEFDEENASERTEGKKGKELLAWKG